MSSRPSEKKFFPMRISSPAFIATIHFWRGRVFHTPPPLTFMIRWGVSKVEEYCQRHGWDYQDLKPYWSQYPSDRLAGPITDEVMTP